MLALLLPRQGRRHRARSCSTGAYCSADQRPCAMTHPARERVRGCMRAAWCRLRMRSSAAYNNAARAGQGVDADACWRLCLALDAYSTSYIAHDGLVCAIIYIYSCTAIRYLSLSHICVYIDTHPALPAAGTSTWICAAGNII
jgi:hypothetical protein